MSIVSRGNGDICSRYRPQRFSEMVGPAPVVKALSKAIALGEGRAKAYLFHGERGCGKTTAARIMSLALNCENGDTPEPCLECESCKMGLDNTASHITEINLAQYNKKDDADDLVSQMHYMTYTGRNRCFIFDEAQMLTKAAQNLLLKKLEEPPPNTYIFICTTEPSKLLKTVQSRCESYQFRLPNVAELKEILRSVTSQEKWEMPDKDKKQFFEAVKGRAYREVLKAIDQVMRGGIASLAFPSDEDPSFIEICQATVKGDWKSVAQALKTIKKEQGSIASESMRICALRYFSSILLGANSNSQSVAKAMNELINPFYEQDAEQRLVLALYNSCNHMKR